MPFAWPAVVGLALTLSVMQAVPPAVSVERRAVTLVGAGDIATCTSRGDERTARILDRVGGTVFTVGDNVYPDGTRREFRRCYDPSWGRHRARTRPSPGNHDYHVARAAGYFGYFNWRAGPGERGYYVYTRGAWRIYSLNSEVMTRRQLRWLRADLRRHTPRCSLAYWHHPRFSSGQHGNAPWIGDLWRPLYRAGVELVINGHDHHYERFAPRRPDGSRAANGIRQFIVGTGGAELRPARDVKRHSVVRHWRSHGVLRLRLEEGRYSWRFLAVGGAVIDAGSSSCHARP